MSLNRLVVRAKKSVSGFFPIDDEQEHSLNDTAKPSQKEKESDTPSLQYSGSNLAYTGSPYPDVRITSECRDSPSRRNKLVGSLRRISSLRSIRSPPSKTKKRDDCPVPPKSPSTPTQLFRLSRILSFQESPPGQPILEIPDPRHTTASSPNVHHSSPISVPCKQETRFDVADLPSLLPAGTIPNSPAPFWRALEMDPTNLASSPFQSPVIKKSTTAEAIPTPLPGTNLTFEDIRSDNVLPSHVASSSRDLPGYFDIPLDDGNKGRAENNDIRCNHNATREVGAVVFQDFQATFSGNATVYAAGDMTKAISSKPNRKDSLEILTSSRNTLTYSRANDRRGEWLVPLNGSGSHHELPKSNVQRIISQDDSQFAASDKTISDMAIPTFATGTLKSDRDGLKHRQSSWGQHTGLYDGTGYGKDASSTTSRPSTSTEKSSEVPDVTLFKARAESKPARSSPGATATTTGGNENLDDVSRAITLQ
ncbi:Nn.00g086880.m01.CDS01 [Neocucurbitaria sp. VM-36]